MNAQTRGKLGRICSRKRQKNYFLSSEIITQLIYVTHYELNFEDNINQQKFDTWQQVPEAMISLDMLMAASSYVDKWGLVDVGQLGPANRYNWIEFPLRTVADCLH